MQDPAFSNDIVRERGGQRRFAKHLFAGARPQTPGPGRPLPGARIACGRAWGRASARSLSFKHTVQLWTEWAARGLCSVDDRQRLFTLIAQCKVGHRPGRIEPRMRKRRPKPFPWLKVPRAQARRQVQRYGHA